MLTFSRRKRCGQFDSHWRWIQQ